MAKAVADIWLPKQLNLYRKAVSGINPTGLDVDLVNENGVDKLSSTLKVLLEDISFISSIGGVRTYESIAAMKMIKNKATNEIVRTRGAFATGDGGSMEYIIKATASGTIDELNIVTLNSGEYAEVVSNGLTRLISQVSHGFTLPVKGYVPVVSDSLGTTWSPANSSAILNVHSAYLTAIPDDNTLLIQTGGNMVVMSHGLTIGETYYLQDNGTEDVSFSLSTYIAPTVTVLNDMFLRLNQPTIDEN